MAGDSFDSRILYECWLHKLKGTKRKSFIIGTYPWRKKYFILRVVGDKPQIEYYNKYPHTENVKPKVKLSLWPAYKVEKISNTKNRAYVFEITTTERRLCLSADDQQSTDQFVFMVQIQTKLTDDVTDDYFIVKPENSDACRRIRAYGKLCILHVAPWGVTLILKESRAVLAQWPIKSIRCYESSGTGIFQLDAGRIAPLGDGQYLFKTEPTHDDRLYDLLDKYVSAASNEGARSPSRKEQYKEYELESNRLRALTVVSGCTNERAMMSRLPSTETDVPRRANAPRPDGPVSINGDIRNVNSASVSSQFSYLQPVPSPSRSSNQTYINDLPADAPLRRHNSPLDVIKHMDRQSNSGYLDMNSPMSDKSSASLGANITSPSRDLLNQLDTTDGDEMFEAGASTDGLFADAERDNLDLNIVPMSGALLMYENTVKDDDELASPAKSSKFEDLNTVPESVASNSDNKTRDDYDLTSPRRNAAGISLGDRMLRDDYNLTSSSKPDLSKDTTTEVSGKKLLAQSVPTVLPSANDMGYANMSVYENMTDKSRLSSKTDEKSEHRHLFKELKEYKDYVKGASKGYIDIDQQAAGDYETISFRAKNPHKHHATSEKTAAMRRSVSNPNFFHVATKNQSKDNLSIGHVTPLHSSATNQTPRPKTPGTFKRRFSRESKLSDHNGDVRNASRSFKQRPRSNSWNKSQPDLRLLKRSGSTDSFRGIFTTAKTKSFARKLPPESGSNGPHQIARSKSVDRLNSRESFGSVSSIGSPNPNQGRRLPSLPDDSNC